MKNKKSTVQEIAAKAGVSVATVSRVLNHRSLVKESTCRKVIDAMIELGYDIHEISPAENEIKNKLILLNMPSLSNPFYSEIVKGAQAAANRHGFYLLINSQHINQDTYPVFNNLMKNINIHGILTLNSISADIIRLIKKQLPMVQCCEYAEELENHSYVSIDDLGATKKVMDYLLSTGHRDIALVSGPQRYKYARHRRKGYLQALEQADIEPSAGWIIQLPEIDFDMALSSITQMLSQQNPPNAVFTTCDVYAAAAIKAARIAGLRVPEDLIVTGFDNVDISQTTNPSITTVSQPKYQLGYMACELLIEKIQNPGMPDQQILLNTELIIRESTVTSGTSSK